MLSFKNILAGLLLMVYTISFGHSVIPQHHHLTEAGEHVEEAHCESDQSDHEHISHDDHYDEGILDFLGCLIENLHQELPADHHSCQAIVIASEKGQTERVTIQTSTLLEDRVEYFYAPQKRIALYANILLVKDFNVDSPHFRRGPPQS